MNLPEQSSFNFLDRIKLSLKVIFSKQVMVCVKKNNDYETTTLCFSKDEIKYYSIKLKTLIEVDTATDDLLKNNLPKEVKF